MIARYLIFIDDCSIFLTRYFFFFFSDDTTCELPDPEIVPNVSRVTMFLLYHGHEVSLVLNYNAL